MNRLTFVQRAASLAAAPAILAVRPPLIQSDAQVRYHVGPWSPWRFGPADFCTSAVLTGTLGGFYRQMLAVVDLRMMDAWEAGARLAGEPFSFDERLRAARDLEVEFAHLDLAEELRLLVGSPAYRDRLRAQQKLSATEAEIAAFAELARLRPPGVVFA